MAIDVEKLEKSLKKKMSLLEKKRAKIEEELQALELVKRASQEVDEIDDLDLELDAEDQAELEDAGAAAEEVVEEVEDEEEEEEVAEDTDEEDTEDEEEVAEGDLSEEEAILEVIKTFKEPLKAAKIAEELVAVGFPFEDAEPADAVTALLEQMAKDGTVKRMRTIKGTFFGLPD